MLQSLNPKILSVLMVITLLIPGLAQAEVDCGISGSEASIPGTGFAGFWQGTLGLVRLIRFQGNVVEGPATASKYLKGIETPNTYTGRFAMDSGEIHQGNFTMTLSQGGRCLKGTLTFDDGGQDEVLAFRSKRPSLPYQSTYELHDGRTARLEKLVGGLLDLSAVDGADFLNIPNNPPALTGIPVSAPSNPPTDDSDSHEDRHERSNESAE